MPLLRENRRGIGKSLHLDLRSPHSPVYLLICRLSGAFGNPAFDISRVSSQSRGCDASRSART